MRRRVVTVLVAAWGLVLLSAVPVLAQPKGQVRDNANQAAQGGDSLVQAAAGFIHTWATGQYAWVLGAVILYLVFRFVARLVRGS